MKLNGGGDSGGVSIEKALKLERISFGSRPALRFIVYIYKCMFVCVYNVRYNQLSLSLTRWRVMALCVGRDQLIAILYIIAPGVTLEIHTHTQTHITIYAYIDFVSKQFRNLG